MMIYAILTKGWLIEAVACPALVDGVQHQQRRGNYKRIAATKVQFKLIAYSPK
jgi:hypothetical protein